MADARIRLKLVIRGAVQGVGFRPFVFRLAAELGLPGWVNNSPQGVFIEVEGVRARLDQFRLRLETDKPARSFIQSCEASWLDPVGYDSFLIRESQPSGDKTALVLPDIATCQDCLRDVFDPSNRRHRYPFTNCTHCGPRFSIIESLPYDRANTSMRGFKMCAACQAEYDDPRNRRFHAQPNACPVCGPRLEFLECGDMSPLSKRGHVRAVQTAALLAAAAAIREGQIVAVKGIGGFHLLVDARNDEALRRLRERKHREEKPFALMFPTLAGIKTVCDVLPLEESLLLSPESPIVLLCRRRESGISDSQFKVSTEVAPHNPNLGVMLPSNPLHHLLMAELGFPVVATSGNLSDEPICTDECEALEKLNGVADAFLVHNRPIVRHVDDSIVRVMLGREMVLRRARGFAPLPVQLAAGILPAIEPGFQPGGQGMNDQETFDFSRLTSKSCSASGGKLPPSTAGRMPAATILAVGAHLKNAVALAVGEQVFISQHIGDLETEEAYRAFRRVAADLPAFYGVQPEIVAADLHPDYVSTKFARESGKNVVGVQHHLAHVLSCMAENEVELPALGVAWDGTGLGTDGTVWGGEFFLVESGRAERIASLRPFRLPGGDIAAREPRRSAFGLLHELSNGRDELLLHMQQKIALMFSATEMAALKAMLDRRINSPLCSSVGRLFDAVAALIGLRQVSRFEGQAAMELEFALHGIETNESYNLPLITRESSLVLDWSPMIEAISSDVQNGVSAGMISARFHNALAGSVVSVARHAGRKRVAMSGGCFQNPYLMERCIARLREEEFQPYWHQRVPPNDGGIALGQAYAARNNVNLK